MMASSAAAAAARSLLPLLLVCWVLHSCLAPRSAMAREWASSSCGQWCSTWDDCEGALTCQNGTCADDEDLHTTICKCGMHCLHDHDCPGFLACSLFECRDDPRRNTHICSTTATAAAPASPSDSGMKSCGVTCSSDDECDGRLACIHATCGDDPTLNTNICSAPSPDSASPSHSPAGGLKSCGDTCASGDECDGQLACIGHACTDDPDLSTHICQCGMHCHDDADCTGKLVCATPSFTCTDELHASTKICNPSTPL